MYICRVAADPALFVGLSEQQPMDPLATQPRIAKARMHMKAVRHGPQNTNEVTPASRPVKRKCTLCGSLVIGRRTRNGAIELNIMTGRLVRELPPTARNTHMIACHLSFE